MSKFKIGDKVYLHKRGVLDDSNQDWTLYNNLGCVRLEKNIIYTVYRLNGNEVRLKIDSLLYYHEDHFKKYEQV